MIHLIVIAGCIVDVNVMIAEKDIEMYTYQEASTRQMTVRLKHKPTGTTAQGRDSNFKRLHRYLMRQLEKRVTGV